MIWYRRSASAATRKASSTLGSGAQGGGVGLGLSDGSMVSYGSDEALGLGAQLDEADGRGDGLRENVGLGLGFWLGCQLPVGLGLGLVDGVGAKDEAEASG